MTGDELRALLIDADRTASWLARQFDVTPTQVARWLDQGVPAAHVGRVLGLLPVPIGLKR